MKPAPPHSTCWFGMAGALPLLRDDARTPLTLFVVDFVRYALSALPRCLSELRAANTYLFHYLFYQFIMPYHYLIHSYRAYYARCALARRFAHLRCRAYAFCVYSVHYHRRFRCERAFCCAMLLRLTRCCRTLLDAARAGYWPALPRQ